MEPSKAGYQMAAIHVTSLQTYEKKGNFVFSFFIKFFNLKCCTMYISNNKTLSTHTHTCKNSILKNISDQNRTVKD